MLDSSSHLQSGFLEGNIVNIGNLDECLNINNSEMNITGKLRTVNILIYYNETIYKYYLYQSIIMGICLPMSCEIEDINDFLDDELNINNFHVQCIDKEEMKIHINTIQTFFM